MANIGIRNSAKQNGLKVYFTGKPCKQGHIAERYTDNGGCVICRRARCSRYGKQNRPRIRERQQRYYDAHPEWYRALRGAIKLRYRARKAKAEGTHSAADIRAILKMQMGRCAYCRKKIGDGFHVDHITPLALGGSNWPSNLQITCDICNCSKQARCPIEFAQSLGMLL